jgi:nitrogen fixation protein NifX
VPVRLALIPEASKATDAPGPRLRVAIGTQDGKSMNAHFGSAQRFAVYEVTPEESHLVEVVSFGDTSDESGTHDAEADRIGPRVAALAGCNLLFVLAIGGPAAAKVVSAKIHPVKLAAPEPIEQVISKVRSMMTSNPPPWLRKVLAASQTRKPSFLDDEED